MLALTSLFGSLPPCLLLLSSTTSLLFSSLLFKSSWIIKNLIVLAPFNIVYFLLDPVFISGSGSSQFLQDIKTLDEKYSLVSSTPSVNLDKRMGKFKTFSESTLLESISETDSECHHRMSEEFNSNNLRFKDRLSSIGGSTTFSDRDAERSFEHYNHHDSVCMCNNSQCQNNQNSTFII